MWEEESESLSHEPLESMFGIIADYEESKTRRRTCRS